MTQNKELVTRDTLNTDEVNFKDEYEGLRVNNTYLFDAIK